MFSALNICYSSQLQLTNLDQKNRNNNFSQAIKMLRITTLFIAALAVATVRAAGDHSWDITPDVAYPQINFDEAHADNEVVFQYTYAGTLGATKTLTNTLYQDDCTTVAGASLTAVPDTATPGIYTVDVGIDEVRLEPWWSG